MSGDKSSKTFFNCLFSVRTEELLALAPSAFLDDLNKARLQLLNGRYMVGEYAHFAGFRRYVDLDAMCRRWLSSNLYIAEGNCPAFDVGWETHTSVDLYID